MSDEGTVWILWLHVERVGWLSQRWPYSPREIVEQHAEARRKFLASCGLAVRSDVRNEEDGPPDDSVPQ